MLRVDWQRFGQAIRAQAVLRQPSNEAEGWRDIASAPKDGTRFDVWVPSETGGYRVADLHFNTQGLLTRDGIIGKDLARWPTYWRPLPAAPDASVQAGGEGERLL